MVAFAGFGSIALTVIKLPSAEILPSGGMGLRYRASEDYGVNIGIDYAFGRNDSAFYVRIGEVF